MNIDQYIGRLLDDRYEILEVIGTGGMAVVYKARCHRLNRLVAIKILKDEYARDEEFRRRFHAEGEAVAMLSNSNIVQVYDVSSTETANFIVMELIDGISLKQYMEKKGVLNWKETLHFAMQIAKGLEHAHSRGIVHRDIKPHNVMVLKNGSVKVMDFGIARVMNKSNTLTKEALGSVHYISPEQAKGGYTDNRSDIYSLSVVIYEMMTGRPPYDGESAVAVAIQHINGGAAMPSTLNPNIPGGLEQIIMKGMALDVKDRYVSATEMLQDMEEFRKNPAILFGYEYKTPMSDATRPITVVQNPPRTTAERVVQNKTGVRPQPKATSETVKLRKTSVQAPVVPAAAPKKRPTAAKPDPGTMNRSEILRRAQQRRLEAEEQKREDERNRVATIAVVVCSAVAVIAIIVFLVALFNGALLNKEKELVEVPFLLGKQYTDELPVQHSGLKFVMRPQEYSEDYNKGEVMKQEPSGGSRVIKDTELYITVSLGPEPEVKTMEDLTDILRDEAETFLRGQGYETLVREEFSDTISAGKITRTDPAHGEPLTPGQTIKLWVSTGPDIITKAMPGVVGKDVDYALNLLDELGFSKVTTREVDSKENKGIVVSQSQLKGVEIDVTTEILLEVSKGPKETTEPPTEAPTEEETTEPTQSVEVVEPEIPEADTRKVTFILPYNERPYVLSIRLKGSEVIEPRTIQPGDTSITLELTGTGTQEYTLYIDGDLLRSEKVTFTDE